MAVIKHFTGVNILNAIANWYYIAGIVVIWGVICFKYYTRSRVEGLLYDFKKKKKWKKITWGIISIVSFILPIIYFLLQ
jgi:hypothetical protein